MSLVKEAKSLGKSAQGVCALCLQSSELRESHIVPAFAFRWLRSRSVTSYVRSSRKPNLRAQDGEKVRLLCETCEQMFSKEEAAFSSKLFKPVFRGADRLSYDEWLLRFSVSLSWRILKHCKGMNPESSYSDEQEKLANEAEKTWRDFLFRRIPHPAKFEQHLLIFKEVNEPGANELPKNINRYLLGGIEMDIVGDTQSLMTFAKIGRFAFFGIIQPLKGRWVDTKVHVRQGTIKPRVFQTPPGVDDFFINRARSL